MNASHEIRFLISPLPLSSEFGRRFALRDLIHDRQSKAVDRTIRPSVLAAR